MKLGIERVAPLIPALMNRVLGQGTVPTATTPRDEMLAAIFETLTEEQMASLQNVLSPSQLANLAMLAQDLQAARGAGQPGAAGPGTPAQSGRPIEMRPPTWRSTRSRRTSFPGQWSASRPASP